MTVDPFLLMANALGFVGAALMLASYLMKGMMPLRIAALCACVFLVSYGALKHALPTLLLYGLLVPINIKKTLAMRKMVQAIERAREDTPLSQWLLPHMHRRTAKAGELLWKQGDAANEMLYLESGSLRLVEYDEILIEGALVGEIGLFSPDHRRTLSLAAATDCVLYSMTGEEMALLYYENPKLGFHVMRLVVARLMGDVSKARATTSPGHRQETPVTLTRSSVDPSF
jgi:CRP/FNR family transcriptional regulator, cyclic AMP receptor protein